MGDYLKQMRCYLQIVTDMPVVNIPIKRETSKKEVVTVVSQSSERVCYFNRKQCATSLYFSLLKLGMYPLLK